jgi:hypothetical protein
MPDAPPTTIPPPRAVVADAPGQSDAALAPGGAESLLALAVGLGQIAVWRYDLVAARLHANEHAYRIFGIEPRPQGMSLDELRPFIHPEDLARVFAATDEALAANGPTDLEARYGRAGGAWRHVLTRRVVQRDDWGRPVALVGVALDLTGRLETQRRADDATRRLELVTRASGIGYWSREAAADRATWSPALRALYGLADGDPVPTRDEWIAQFVHPEDRERVRRGYAEWSASGRDALDLEFHVLRRGGDVRQLRTHTRIERREPSPLLFGVVIDVTGRQVAEGALRRARERAELAARGAGIGTWEQDLQHDIAFWDEQMWRLRGHPPRPGAMSEPERLACVHPDDRARVQVTLGDARARGEPLDYEFRVVWPDGQVRWLASRSVELRDEATGLRRRIGVNWDVTASRAAEAAARERELAQRESHAKSRFLARMSHELRTPLNAVLGFSQLLLAEERGDTADGARRRQRLEHIRAAGQHLLTLIDDVLDLARVEGGELRMALQPVALEPLVQDSLPLVLPQAQARGVVVRAQALGARVLADPVRLRQVLLNLLTNAIKYNRDGGRVTIDARAEGVEVVLRVADTGRGMSAEQLERLFEPFNRLGAERDPIEGTGIGLAIVKALVQTMGGRVEVASEPGSGSVFEVRLAAAPAERDDTGPVLQPQALRAGARHAGNGAPHASSADVAGRSGAAVCAGTAGPADAPARPSLLYIEDHAVNAMILRELVDRRRDIELVVAGDGRSGVEAARALRPSLVLLDMQLPDFDGFEVLRRLRADPATAGIAVVALSANAMPEDVRRALAAGVADYWTKPLDVQRVTERLDRWFGPAAAPGARAF